MRAICKREFASYFNSMTGWVFCAALSLFIGLYFMAYNLFSGHPYFSAALDATLFLLMVLVLNMDIEWFSPVLPNSPSIRYSSKNKPLKHLPTLPMCNILKSVLSQTQYSLDSLESESFHSYGTS